ncbi:hypothetical protein SCYAM73S_06196 [Streptomyces cyaneofuscatus]
MQVLQDEDDRAVGRHPLQEPDGELEEAGGAVLVGRVAGGLAELGEEPGQLALLSGARGGHLLGQGAAQGAQGGGKRGVRQPFGADLHAAADGHHGVAPGRPAGELLHQPGLADARLTADQQCLRFTGPGAGERFGERTELRGASDEPGTD